MPLFLGLMSGTSMDGVDAVLCEWPDGSDAAAGAPRELAFAHRDYDHALREELLALNQAAGHDELARAALAANAVAEAYAQACTSALAAAGVAAHQVCAVGAHGQTVRHQPARGFTTQLLNGSLLAELCGMDVVCDFRSRDVAAGGQGAPLVPAFHAACFARTGEDCAVLNIGGIANLTLLPAQGPVRGFDTGPGNLLMDAWASRHLGRPFDADGALAARGQVHEAGLQLLLSDPYFSAPPPKSTGRDHFHEAWLQHQLGEQAAALSAADGMATLAALTAHSVADALRTHLPAARSLLVCGGGARNGALMAQLQAVLPRVNVGSTAEAGMDPQHVEALAFAWLARAFVLRASGNLPAVTGARGLRVLGALHPGASGGI